MNRLLLGIYQIVFAIGGCGYLVVRSVRGRFLPGIWQRLGFYPKELLERLASFQQPIWLHLVSVGEVLAAQTLVERIRAQKPHNPWVITTVTPTGQEVAKSLIRGPQDVLLYLPWDLSPVVRRVVRRLSPRLFISFETELWPVLFDRLSREKVPIVVVNGRISPKAYGRYLWARPFMGRVLSKVDFVCAQSAPDARRFAALGAPKDRIVVTGNLKWDKAPGDHRTAQVSRDSFREMIGLSNGALLWTAGSTHPGEEKMVLEAYRTLKEECRELRLLIAPRHPQRVPDAEREVHKAGFSSVRRSQLSEPTSHQAGLADSVILLDTLGELSAFYRASDIVFVGGSLVPHGGHNLIEPASVSRPIVTGPHLHNFESVAQSLIRAGGLTVVHSQEELTKSLLSMLRNPSYRAALGHKAFSVIAEHKGATDRTVDLLLRKYLR